MKHGKYENKAVSARKSASIRSLALLLALVLLVGGGIGGTIAWLTAKTTEVKNTFSTSDITIELDETDTDPSTEGEQHSYKMIPGWTIDKDPYVTVKAGSEACFLFVEVSESDTLQNYIEYAVNIGNASTEDGVTHGGWTRGTGDSGNGVPTNVYYREVAKSDADQVFAVLGSGSYTYKDTTYARAHDQVLTKPEVT